MTWQEEAREAVDLGLDQLLLSPMSRGEVLDGIEHRLAPVVAAEVARAEARGKVAALRAEAARVAAPEGKGWRARDLWMHQRLIEAVAVIEAEAGESHG